MKTKLIPALLATALAALVAAGVAAAHVKLDPFKAPTGSDTRFAVVVPSEDPKSPTVKITVKIPSAIVAASFEAKPGWKRTVTIETPAKPIVMDGATVKSRISSVTWTATAGGIAPGDYGTFGILVSVPGKAGSKLVWPTVQTYANGTTARWIGPPDADQPAPVVTVMPTDPAAGA